MPEYLYRCECGQTYSTVRRMGEAPRKLRCAACGRLAPRDFHAEQGKQRHGDIWPLWSDFAGCHPSQTAEMQEALANKGVKAEYDAEGRIKFENRRHRNECLRALGYVDKDAGFGDYSGK